MTEPPKPGSGSQSPASISSPPSETADSQTDEQQNGAAITEEKPLSEPAPIAEKDAKEPVQQSVEATKDTDALNESSAQQTNEETQPQSQPAPQEAEMKSTTSTEISSDPVPNPDDTAHQQQADQVAQLPETQTDPSPREEPTVALKPADETQAEATEEVQQSVSEEPTPDSESTAASDQFVTEVADKNQEEHSQVTQQLQEVPEQPATVAENTKPEITDGQSVESGITQPEKNSTDAVDQVSSEAPAEKTADVNEPATITPNTVQRDTIELSNQQAVEAQDSVQVSKTTDGVRQEVEQNNQPAETETEYATPSSTDGAECEGQLAEAPIEPPTSPTLPAAPVENEPCQENVITDQQPTNQGETAPVNQPQQGEQKEEGMQQSETNAEFSQAKVQIDPVQNPTQVASSEAAQQTTQEESSSVTKPDDAKQDDSNPSAPAALADNQPVTETAQNSQKVATIEQEQTLSDVKPLTEAEADETADQTRVQQPEADFTDTVNPVTNPKPAVADMHSTTLEIQKVIDKFLIFYTCNVVTH